MLFGVENGTKSDFPQEKSSTISLFDVPTYRGFVILIIVDREISRKMRTELGFEFHDTRRSDTRRVDRSTRAQHVLGNCVRLVARPARNSRSRKELSLSRIMSCLRRSQSEKTACDSLVQFIPATRRICFAQRSQLPRGGHNAHDGGQRYTQSDALPLRASRYTGDVSKLCTRVGNAYSLVIRRNPFYNPYFAVQCLRGLVQNCFQSLYQPVEKRGQKKYLVKFNYQDEHFSHQTGPIGCNTDQI